MKPIALDSCTPLGMSAPTLIPKIPWHQGHLLFGYLEVQKWSLIKKIIPPPQLNYIFFLTFWQHQARPDPILYEEGIIQCSIIEFFVFSSRVLRCSHVANIAQGLVCKDPNNKFVSSIKSWIFTLFQNLFFAHGCTLCKLQYDHLNSKLKSWIFFKKVTNFIVLEFFSKTYI